FLAVLRERSGSERRVSRVWRRRRLFLHNVKWKSTQFPPRVVSADQIDKHLSLAERQRNETGAIDQPCSIDDEQAGYIHLIDHQGNAPRRSSHRTAQVN